MTIIEVPGIKDMYQVCCSCNSIKKSSPFVVLQVALQEICCDSDDDQYLSNVSFILLPPQSEVGLFGFIKGLKLLFYLLDPKSR